MYFFSIVFSSCLELKRNIIGYSASTRCFHTPFVHSHFSPSKPQNFPPLPLAPKSAKGTITKGKASSKNKEEEEFGFVFYKIAGANVETLYCDHDLLREMKGMILPGGLYRDTVIKMVAALKQKEVFF